MLRVRRSLSTSLDRKPKGPRSTAGFAQGGRRLWSSAAAVALAVALGAAVAQAAPFVYVTNAGDAAVSQYNVGASGLLAPLSPPTVAAGEVPLGVAVSPDGQSVYVTDFGPQPPGNVLQYDVGPSGALTPKSPATVAAGIAPEGLAVSPESVYVANNGSGSVSQYDVDGDGALSPKTPATVAAGFGPFGVAVSPLPRVPTSKAQCKHGGWKQFGFKNQGRCVRSVKHGPKT